MKEFLRAFSSGVFEKNLSGEQKELVRNLLNIGAISAHKGRLRAKGARAQPPKYRRY